MSQRSFFHLVLLFFFMFTAAAGIGQEVAAADNVIKIGAAVSLSGKFAREGEFLRQGYDYWKDEANARGGIDIGGKKYQIEIIYNDDESEPQTSARLTEKLITEDKVNFLFGPYSSGIATATAAISEKYNVLTIVPMATADSIYQRGYRFIFCPSPLASTGLFPVLDLIESLAEKPSTVAIVGPDSLFPNITAEAAKKKAEQMGLKVIYTAKYPQNTPDLSGVVTELKSKNPEVVLTTGYTQDSILLIKSMRELQINPKMIGLAMSIAVPDFRNALGPAADQVLGVDYWVPTLTYTGPIVKDSAEYAKKYMEKFGKAPTYQAASGTAGGIVLQMALEAAKSNDPKAVREALLQMNSETFYGKVKFNEQGVDTAAKLNVTQIQDGQPRVVFPVEVRETPAQYPKGPWK
ncbi:MAG: amino acid ABC transporter substrate-binding protein [Syntrophobacter sp.]